MTDQDEYVNTRFRITAWPERIPLPGVLAGTYTLDRSGSVLLLDPPERGYRSQGETYLALYAIDLDDVDEILSFANEHAHLAGAEMQLRYDEANLVLREDLETTVVEEQLAALRASGSPGGSFDLECLEEFRFGARLLRDLTTAWLVASGQRELATVEWQWTPYSSHHDARALLRAYLSPLLRDLHPQLRIDVDPDLGDDEWEAPVVAIRPHELTAHHLFEVCAAELYNHIVSGTPFKVCGNETCSRFFVRQRGRSKHEQYRLTGVKYCSVECARAQSQRQYRRRQRQAD